MLRAVVAVYSSHPSEPLSLFARVRSFSAQGFRKLDQDRLALRVPAMRESVYLVPAETARSAVAATLPAPDDPYWQKRYSHKGRAIPEDKYSEWREQILKLATRPLGVAELNVCIPNIKPVLNRMAFEGSLLRVGAEGLRSNAIRYVAIPGGCCGIGMMSGKKPVQPSWRRTLQKRGWGVDDCPTLCSTIRSCG